MNKAVLLRRALWASAFFNAGGALIFFFPASIGRLAQVPLPAPILYSWFCGAVISIFAVIYAWLARQGAPNREFVLVGAIGKLAFFAVSVASWLSHESSARIFTIASVDLVLAMAFLYCLPKRGAR